MSQWFDRFGFAPVLDHLLIGAYPRDAADVEQLAQVGVDRVYNLCEDGEYSGGERLAVEASLREHDIEEQRLPLVDYGGLASDGLEHAVGDVLDALRDGRHVYLHCRAGWQRSATVAAGVIALHEGLPIEEALRVMRQRKPTAEPMDHQRADLLAWFAARPHA